MAEALGLRVPVDRIRDARAEDTVKPATATRATTAARVLATVG